MATPARMAVSVLRPEFDNAQYSVSLTGNTRKAPVAFIHFSVGSRSKLVDKAPASVHCAYLLREPYGPAAAHVDYIIRQSDKTQTREDLMYSAARNLPPFAEGSPSGFFAAGEQYGRVNANLAQTRTMALPRELTLEQQIVLCHTYCESQFGGNHPYMFAIHSARASDGLQNNHMHLIYSTKTLDSIERDAQQFWKRYSPEHPERGGAKVERSLSDKRVVYGQRQGWSDCTNRALELAGSEARVSAQSFAQRGIVREEDRRHLPAWHPTQYKYGRGTSQEWQERLDGQAAREAARAEEHAQAAEAWEIRKQQLDISIDMPRDQFIARVHDTTRAYQSERHTERELAQDAATIQAQLRGLEQYRTKIEVEQTIERAFAHMGKERSPASVRQVEALLGAENLLEMSDLTRRWERPLIGNRVSQIYHTPEHKNYGDVHPTHQVHFWTEQQAMDAGYRRAANDHYGRGTGTAMTVETRQAYPLPTDGGSRTPRTSLEDRVAVVRRRQTSRGVAAGLAQLEDDTIQGGVKVQLHDKEHDRGYSY
jgi:hypothetical protein